MNREMLWLEFSAAFIVSILCQIALAYFNPFNVSTSIDERISMLYGFAAGWAFHAFMRWRRRNDDRTDLPASSTVA